MKQGWSKIILSVVFVFCVVGLVLWFNGKSVLGVTGAQVVNPSFNEVIFPSVDLTYLNLLTGEFESAQSAGSDMVFTKSPYGYFINLVNNKAIGEIASTAFDSTTVEQCQVVLNYGLLKGLIFQPSLTPTVPDRVYCLDTPKGVVKLQGWNSPTKRLRWAFLTSKCVPFPEVCNGRDDDCDDAVDEGVPSVSSLCTVGVGACSRSGTAVSSCVNGALVASECSATAADPTAETCDNGVDDDCDGFLDESCASTCSIPAGESFTCSYGITPDKNELHAGDVVGLSVSGWKFVYPTVYKWTGSSWVVAGTLASPVVSGSEWIVPAPGALKAAASLSSVVSTDTTFAFFACNPISSSKYDCNGEVTVGPNGVSGGGKWMLHKLAVGPPLRKYFTFLYDPVQGGFLGFDFTSNNFAQDKSTAKVQITESDTRRPGNLEYGYWFRLATTFPREVRFGRSYVPYEATVASNCQELASGDYNTVFEMKTPWVFCVFIRDRLFKVQAVEVVPGAKIRFEWAEITPSPNPA